MTSTTFLVPDFDKSIKDTVHDLVQVISPSALLFPECKNYLHPAIAKSGFSSRTDGVYVVVMKIHEMEDGSLMTGFTDMKTFGTKDSAFIGYIPLKGTSIYCANGICEPDYHKHESKDITATAQEIISVFTISNNGKKKEVQWYFDQNYGGVDDCTNHFGNGDEIFPYIGGAENGLLVEFVEFDKVVPLSPEMEELMKEFKRQRKQEQQPISSAPSTSTAENDALISQLREQVARSQDVLLADRDARIRTLVVLLAAQTKEIEAKNHQLQFKDQFLDRCLRETRQDMIQQVDLSQKQLELERAEHQKTRNLLHQTKLELKDMEIKYLTKEKESGQRREREEENNDELKDKQDHELE